MKSITNQVAEETSGMVVPFGKYKGQPIEQLQHDPGYVDWLLGQDWFREKFRPIHTVIINNFTEPDNTPEHNRLQAMFLCWRFTFCVLRSAFPARFSKLDDLPLPESENARLTPLEHEITFEDRAGWDVYASFSMCIKDGEYYEHYFSVITPIEIKPSLGDDYPKVLREVKSRRSPPPSTPLVYAGKFSATGAGLEQVREIYRSSGVRLLVADEVDFNADLSAYE